MYAQNAANRPLSGRAMVVKVWRRMAHGTAARAARRAWNVPVDSKTKGDAPMNRDRVEGNWEQMKGRIKQKWGKLTDDDLDYISGKRQELAGKIQERYGIAKEEAERELKEFEDSVDPMYRPRI